MKGVNLWEHVTKQLPMKLKPVLKNAEFTTFFLKHLEEPRELP